MVENKTPILEINNLKIIHKKTNKTIVREINLELYEKEILGIVGESGSGKSITMHSIMGITPDSLYVDGEIIFEGMNINNKVSSIRGRKIGMIFQDPLNALNPVLRIKDQLRILSKSHNISYEEANKEICKIFDRIGIQNQERVLKSFPHQLSGGMLQRVVIAFVLLLKPKVIIADEPTTSLDVSIQKEITKILKEIKNSFGISIIFITHDLLLANDLCDRIAIMYAGYIVEKGNNAAIFTSPIHPYTKGLISSVPTVNTKPVSLQFITGRVPHFSEISEGCPFAPRCPIVQDICHKEMPKTEYIGESQVRCFFAEKPNC